MVRENVENAFRAFHAALMASLLFTEKWRKPREGTGSGGKPKARFWSFKFALVSGKKKIKRKRHSDANSKRETVRGGNEEKSYGLKWCARAHSYWKPLWSLALDPTQSQWISVSRISSLFSFLSPLQFCHHTTIFLSQGGSRQEVRACKERSAGVWICSVFLICGFLLNLLKWCIYVRATT